MYVASRLINEDNYKQFFFVYEVLYAGCEVSFNDRARDRATIYVDILRDGRIIHKSSEIERVKDALSV